MTQQDEREFQEYLAQCTDNQVLAVYEKERSAGRRAYAQLARTEAASRGLWHG